MNLLVSEIARFFFSCSSCFKLTFSKQPTDTFSIFSVYCAPNDGSLAEGYCITGGIPIEPNSVDCSVTNKCSGSCSEGICIQFGFLNVELCTEASRPSGTCVERTGVI